MSLQKYIAYTDSGVEWIGHAPAHWKIDRIKASIVSSRNGIWGDEPQADENDIACVRVADFDRNKLQVKPQIPTIRSVTEKERNGRVLQRGDLLLEKSGGGESQPVGQVVMYQLEMPAVCSNFVARVVLKPGMNSGYWNYVHNAAYSVGVNLGSINQTSGIQNLDQDRYFNERAPFPPEVEQSAIAAFLDHETAKIDALIAEHEKLIALLAEKRYATISHAVTCGIDPEVRKKESGVEWLGEVPAHWDLMPLKRAVVLQRGHDLPSDERVEGNIPVVSSGGISGYHNEPITDSPTVVTGRYGTIGEFTYVEENCWPLNTALYAVEMHGNCAKYIWYMLQSLKHIFVLNSLKSAVPGVDRNDIHPVTICLAPLAEQYRISAFLDAETAKIDSLKAESERTIALLKERRSAVIAAAVTGQIDVRGAVAQAAVESPEALAA